MRRNGVFRSKIIKYDLEKVTLSALIASPNVTRNISTNTERISNRETVLYSGNGGEQISYKREELVSSEITEMQTARKPST